MFANFSLPDVARVSRRTVIGGLVTGALGLVASLIFDAPLLGVGLCVGIGMGVFNFRLIQRSVAKIGERDDESHRRPLAMNTLGRLGAISVVALGVLLLSRDLGLGLLVGLALFQAILLVNVTRSMFKMGHAGSAAYDAVLLGGDPDGPAAAGTAPGIPAEVPATDARDGDGEGA